VRIIGENLKRLRKAKRLSMTALEDISGVKQSIISRIETGKKNPEPETVERLARALDVDVQYFYFEESRLPTKVLPAMPEDLVDFVVEAPNVPYLVLGKGIKESEIPLEVIEQLLRAWRENKR